MLAHAVVILRCFNAVADEVCELCDWEDDGQDDPHADEVWGGPNGAYSLADARLNFKHYYIMYDPHEITNHIGGSGNSAIEDQAEAHYCRGV